MKGCLTAARSTAHSVGRVLTTCVCCTPASLALSLGLFRATTMTYERANVMSVEVGAALLVEPEITSLQRPYSRV